MRATISPDQFMLASSVSAGFPKPSTEWLAKSSGVSGVEPRNSCPEMIVGGFFLAGMMNTKIGAIRKCCEHG